MHAEIIAIGTELTTGAKLDTNSQWLSIELASVGIPVLLHTTVADDLPAMLETLRAAMRRSDIVLISGGLGPTLDDLTRQALAELAGVELVLHEPSLQYIREMFAKRKRIMPERNVIQAMFPAGSQPIENPHGSAPGVWMELSISSPFLSGEGGRRPGEGPETLDAGSSIRNAKQSNAAGSLTPALSQREREPGNRTCLIAAMPGVPSEMKPMFRERILPRLPRSDKVIRRARVNCYGVGESACEEMLGDVTARGRDPEVGITVHEGTITLRIEAHGATESECDVKIADTKRIIRERLGELVFGEEDEQLEDIVIRELNRRGQTVAVADEATGGVLSLWLTATPGSDRCFRGGIVGVAAEQLFELPVPTEQTEQPENLPQERARQLAQETRERFRTDFAVAIAGSLTTQDIPRLGLALADSSGVEVQEHIPVADVSFARNRAAKSALDMLRLRLS